MPTAASKNGTTAEVLDIDKILSGRREANKETIPVKIGSVAVELPPELPFAVAEALEENDLRGAFDALLGEKASKAFFATSPSVDDVKAVAVAIMEKYGVNRGESQASTSS